MIGAAVRLQATAQDAGVYLFAAQFSAPESDEMSSDLAAVLTVGDGATYDLGMISLPTTVTWREQRAIPLMTHRYRSGGPHTAELWLDGVSAASVIVEHTSDRQRSSESDTTAEGPELFAIAPVANEPFQRMLRLNASGLPAGWRLRVDAGAGQVRDLAGEEGQEVLAEMLLSYPKPGLYTVSAELLDGEGFWLETLAETPLEITPPDAGVPDAAAPDETGAADRWGTSAAGGPADVLTTTTLEEMAESAADAAAAPWLPYRNFKARAGGTRTYGKPGGGGGVRRYVGAGVWLTARSEQIVGGVRWYQTAGGDWVNANTVEFFRPSGLRGIQFDGTVPEPPPPTPPPPSDPVGNRKGVVTAATLNVRARPGATAGNPPIGVLRAGAQVTVLEEQAAGGAVWYRVGANRWVAARWVRLIESRATALETPSAAAPTSFPFGWVVPELIDVRAKPGVAASSPVIKQLPHYAVCSIVQEATVSGGRWYQVGDQEWVEARHLGVARLRTRPSSIRKGELWVAVNLSQQTAVCYENDRPVYAALAATGLPGAPTVQGIFRTWGRYNTGKMSGPGYYIEDVTWTSYFYGGYALHTAYWHDKFGKPRSHGCVNLSPYDAWWIYQWSAKGGPRSPTVYVYWA